MKSVYKTGRDKVIKNGIQKPRPDGQGKPSSVIELERRGVRVRNDGGNWERLAR